MTAMPSRHTNQPVPGLLQLAGRSAGLTLLFLLLPLLAMLLTSEMQWGPEDFAAAALLIFTGCFGTLLCRRYLAAAIAQWLAIGLLMALVLLIWLELAVGIV